MAISCQLHLNEDVEGKTNSAAGSLHVMRSARDKSQGCPLALCKPILNTSQYAGLVLFFSSCMLCTGVSSPERR